jgi:hypothetical protein
VYDGTDTRAFGLLIGAALAAVWPARRAAPPPACTRRLPGAAGVAGLVIVGLLVWRTNEYSPFMFRGGLVLLSVATALVVAAVAGPGSLLGRVLGCRPPRWLQVRSYGVYLWHYPVILLAAPAAGAGLAGGPAGLSAPRGPWRARWRVSPSPRSHGGSSRNRCAAGFAAPWGLPRWRGGCVRDWRPGWRPRGWAARTPSRT